MAAKEDTSSGSSIAARASAAESAASCPGGGHRLSRFHALAVRRVRHDRIAMNAVLLTLLLPPLWFFSPFAAAAALFLSIRHRHATLSVLPVGRVRLRLAGILGGLLLAGWLGLGLYWLARIL